MNKYFLYLTALSLFVSADVASQPIAARSDFSASKKKQEIPSTRDYTCFVDASFLYWYVKEDGLNIAESAVITESSMVGPLGSLLLAPNSKVFKSSFSYEPGFKVQAGLKGNQWKLYGQYTWLKSKTTASRNAPVGTFGSIGAEVWQLDSWFLQTNTTGGPLGAASISSTWNLKLDMAELLACYSLAKRGNIDVSTCFGLCAAWIDQRLNISIIESIYSAAGGTIYYPSQPVGSFNKSDSSSVGPKAGMTTQYLFPRGFRFEGMFGMSLLYTYFKNVKHKEDASSTASDVPNGATDLIGNYSAVSPLMEIGLGLGWHKDLYDNRYAIDFLASYDFSLFWRQNAMRQMMDDYWTGIQPAAGDLYFHGLTAQGCFKF